MNARRVLAAALALAVTAGAVLAALELAAALREAEGLLGNFPDFGEDDEAGELPDRDDKSCGKRRNRE